MTKLYEQQLGDVLWEIDNRTRRSYKRVVVKVRTRKRKRTNGRPMSHAAKVAGWDKAAVKFMREHPVRAIRQPSITMEEAVQIDANSRSAAKRTAGKRLTPVDNLIGVDFGLLFVWKLSQTRDVKKFHCLCACGKTCEVAAGMLLNGRKTDCGCRLKAKRRQQRRRKHVRYSAMLTDAGTPRKRAPNKRLWSLY